MISRKLITFFIFFFCHTALIATDPTSASTASRWWSRRAFQSRSCSEGAAAVGLASAATRLSTPRLDSRSCRRHARTRVPSCLRDCLLACVDAFWVFLDRRVMEGGWEQTLGHGDSCLECHPNNDPPCHTHPFVTPSSGRFTPSLRPFWRRLWEALRPAPTFPSTPTWSSACRHRCDFLFCFFWIHSSALSRPFPSPSFFRPSLFFCSGIFNSLNVAVPRDGRVKVRLGGRALTFGQRDSFPERGTPLWSSMSCRAVLCLAVAVGGVENYCVVTTYTNRPPPVADLALFACFGARLSSAWWR